MTKPNLFMIGGAKGVGKTKITTDVAADLRIQRVETGKVVLDYVSQGRPLEKLMDYLTDQILSFDNTLILDTHYAQYSDREEPNKQFKRGLEAANLEKLSSGFNIFPCLVEVPLCELEQRRLTDLKRRVVNPSLILQEVEFNRRGYELYIAELKREPFILVNGIYARAKTDLIKWINQNNRALL